MTPDVGAHTVNRNDGIIRIGASRALDRLPPVERNVRSLLNHEVRITGLTHIHRETSFFTYKKGKIPIILRHQLIYVEFNQRGFQNLRQF